MKIKHFSFVFVWVALGAAVALSNGFNIQSPSFAQGGKLPKSITCDGAGHSPALKFGTPPKGTKSLAILGWDDDAPTGLASQWVVYDIPTSIKSLPEGIVLGSSVENFKQGKNSFGILGWSAPCPAKGTKPHHYYIDFYAINTTNLGLPAGSSLNAVHSAIKKHKLLEAKLMGVYGR
jgi:Raf kinase inhibitor-like YbhB/YbcL family protein